MTIKVLLVAVSKYNSELKCCELPGLNDLYAMKHALNHGLKISDSSLLVLGESGIVYRNDFIDVLAKFYSDSADISIFYFSGHGGNGCLAFTDGLINLQSIIDCIKSSKSKNKIIILDCCDAGNFLLMDENNLDKDISLFKETNCAVLASCRKDESSGFNDKKVSLYTSFLCDAFTYNALVRKGQLSLESVVNYVDLLAGKWAEKHKTSQHPIFRSSMPGSIFFPVKEYVQYKADSFTSEQNNYIIAAVEACHSSTSKRYAVKVILKEECNLEEISAISHHIKDEVANLEIFKSEMAENRFKGKAIDILFFYFGYDESDVCFGTWQYRSFWVAKECDKKYWYSKRKSQVIDGICVIKEDSYSLARHMKYTDMTQAEYILKVYEYTDQVIGKAREFIRIFREFKNGTIEENELIYYTEAIRIEINFCRSRFDNLPAFYVELQEWSEICYQLSGSILDFSLYWSQKGLTTWSLQDRISLTEHSIQEYQEGLQKLEDYEKKPSRPK